MTVLDRLGFLVPGHPDCVKAVRDAATLCSELGHEIVEDTPSINKELKRIYLVLFLEYHPTKTLAIYI
jgi:hypothetical protein